QAAADSRVQAALRGNRLKTASYTGQRPTHLGAALAGASTEVIETLLRFGSDIGVAFQLRDDLLGVFGDPAVTGKPAGDDLREGKRTVLIAEAVDSARQHGQQAALDELRSALGNPALTTDGVQRVQTILTELGAASAVERRITDLTASAMRTLHQAD